MSSKPSTFEPLATSPRSLVEDLYRVPENDKAEIIQGRIVRRSPTGARPGRTAGRIFVSLSLYEERLALVRVRQGYAFGDNVGG